MIWNAFILAVRAIRRNLLRSSLTVLGIVIGVAAVITMVTIGKGATVKVTQDISQLGANLLIVRPGQRVGMQRTEAPQFKLADAEAVAREVNTVTTVAPTASRALAVVAGNESWLSSIYGVDNRYFEVGNWNLASGRPFAQGELRSGAAVCVLGDTVRRQLFGARDPVGDKVRFGKVSCQVIGLLAAKGQTTTGMDQDDMVLTPLRTYWRRVAGNQDITSMQISARDGVATERAVRDVTHVLRERRHIAPHEDDDFTVMDLQEIARTLAGTTQVLTGLLGAVAAVSLLVGGIGIMNIMLVSVTERTREIGIRLAIGALERDVLLQFLIEAVVLSSFGGVAGILIAIAAAAGIAQLLKVPLILDPGMILLAFLFAVAVGVVFGFFPARKAARLDPIEALRYE
ncbi:MAG: ABC transporter permease [Gammaproteobacteria bacterium]|nr:ABC transporter permease [Gammaproteobacteria bacterium]